MVVSDASAHVLVVQVRIRAYICVVLAAYYSRIRLIHDPLAQYARNTQLVARWRPSSVPSVPSFVNFCV